MWRLGSAAVALVLLTVSAASTASAERRVTLLIGNKDYKADAARQCTSGPRLDTEDF